MGLAFAAVVVSIKAQGAGGWLYHEGSAGAARDEIGNAAGRAAESADLAGYYGSDGTRPGRWIGAAEDLARYRVGAPRSAVARAQLSRVLDEGRLGDGTALGVQRSKRALYDVTFSAPKSVSVLWSDADVPTRARIEEAVLRSAETVLADLSGHACQVRRGKAPATRQLEGRGLVAAAYVEGTSRAGDPQLHVHMLVPSVVEGSDGKWSRLDARALYPESRTADAVGHAVLRRELTDAVGVGWGPVNERTGAAEVFGVDLSEVEEASKRRAQVEAYVAEHRGGQEAAKGRPLTAHELTALRQEACLRTRAGKDVHATEDVVAGWQDGRDARTGRSREQRWADYQRAWSAAREHAAATITGQPVLRGEALLAETARRVSRPSFTAAQVRRVAAQLLDPAVPAGRVLDAVDAAGRDALTHAVDLSPDDVPVPAGQRRYATEAQLAAELDIALLAEAGRTSRAGGVSEPAGRLAEAPDAAGRVLDAEQAAAVRALTSPGRVRLLVAPAGAGKTFVLAQAVRAWQHDGRQVVLLAAQGKAADVAAAEIGRAAAGPPIQAMTLARAFGTDDRGPHGEQARRWQAELAAAARTRGAVLLVDEAGVVDTGMLARVLTWSAAHDVAVRLVGDPKQQQAVGAGGMLGYLARDPQRTVELGTVRRFTDPAEGPASIALRGGDPAGWDFYQARDRIQAVDSAAAAVREAVVAAAADRAAGRHTLIVTATDRQRREAAEASHQLVMAEHAAAGDKVDVRSYGRIEVAVGEPVRARRNHYGIVDSAGAVLRNGSEWTVTAVGADQISGVRRDDPSVQICLPADYVRDHVEHGYAITAYRGQGLTCDRGHVVGAEQMSREALYVAVTRARDGGRLLVPAADPVEARDQLADSLGRVGEHHAALDLLTDRLDTAREAARRRPTGQGDRGPAGARSEPSPPPRADPAREMAAERARRAADELRQRRDQLRRVLGTDASPGRRALTARRVQLDRADLQLRTSQARRRAGQQAQDAAQAAWQEATQHRGQSERPRMALRLAGTSRAEQQRLAADRSAVAADWQRRADHDHAEATAAHDSAWRAAEQAAGAPLRRDGDLRMHLTRVRAALTGPDAVRAADRADQQAFAQLGRDIDRLTEQAERLRSATRSEPAPPIRDVDADAEPAVRSLSAGGQARTYAGDQGEVPENVAPGEQDAARQHVPDADRRHAAEQRAAQLVERIRGQRDSERPQAVADRGPDHAWRGSPTRKGSQMHQRERSHDCADHDERSAERPAATPAGAEAKQLVDQSFPEPARSRVRSPKQPGPAEPSPEVRAAEIRRRIERSRQYDRDRDRGLGR